MRATNHNNILIIMIIIITTRATLAQRLVTPGSFHLDRQSRQHVDLLEGKGLVSRLNPKELGETLAR